MNDNNNNNEFKFENFELLNNIEFYIFIKDIIGKEFNGLFELFYFLIKERKMDILNINLVEVI